jgi:cytochrome b
MEKSYIWSMTNRVVHVLMIVLFGATYLTAEGDELLKYHAILGFLLALVIFFRIIWGYIGPKYSKFSDFNFNKNELKEYILSPFSNIKKHIGHNPASSWAIITIFVFGILSVVTGMLAYGVEQNHGIFSAFYSETLKRAEIFEGLHELLVNLFIGVIIAHIAGSLIDKYIKKNDAIDSMITGYKNTEEKIVVKTNVFQKSISIIAVFIFLFSIYYLTFVPDNIFIK